MAYTFDVGGALISPSVTAGSAAMYRLKQQLVAAGWTVTSSGDGLAAYSAVGDILSGFGSGANGLGNDLAWFRITSPDTNAREFTFQRQVQGSVFTGTNWRVKYSGGPATGFTGGSPSSTQTPSATDEAIVVGAGTDASPTGELVFPRTDSTGYYVNIVTGGAAENRVWWFGVNRPGTTALAWVMYMDVMQAGTYPAQDADPAIVYRGVNLDDAQIFQNYVFEYGAVGPRGWVKKGLVGETFSRISGVLLGTGSPFGPSGYVFPAGGGQNPYTGKDDLFPLMYARTTEQTAPTGWKGVSTFLLVSSFTRSSGDTYNLVGSKDRITMSGTAGTSWLTIPWNGSDMIF